MDARSVQSLEGVHPALAAVAHLAWAGLPTMDGLTFVVTEGLRSQERQAQLVKSGASRTMHSKHVVGKAFDIAAVVDGKISWEFSLYQRLAGELLAAAKELGVNLVWGGSWASFKDGVHFELDDPVYNHA